MTSPATAPARRPRGALLITAAILAVLLIAFFIFAGLYADFLWFDQLGFSKVLVTEWVTISALFVIGFLGMAVPVYVSIQLAYRLRPLYAKLTAQLDRYQQVIEPLRRLVMLGIPIVIGLFAAVSASSRWQAVLLFLNGDASAGTPDPQFGMHTGFYLFTLPMLHGLVGFISAVLVICVLATAATAYLYGAIRITGRDIRVSRASRVQLAVTLAVFLVVQAVSLYLDRFITLYESNSGSLNITGAGFADVNAVIPSRLILAVCALLVAVLFIVTAVIGRWRLPIIGTSILIVASIIIGSIYPWIVQNLQVNPSQRVLEAAYIERNIKATRDAYDVAGVKQIAYNATTTAKSGALRADAETTASIRIIDPALVSSTFGQLQQFQRYYQFNATLDVDRYTIDGKSQDTVVGVRELDQSGLGSSQTANGNAFVYTHGYGLVAAAGNERESDGTPVFLESKIPQTGSLGTFEPRVYFGEGSPEYSVVGAPKGTQPIELDYATTSGTTGQQSNTFTGSGGPSVGNVFNRLIYALKFQSDQILLSSSVNADSQILYDRDPISRVQKVAPYLTLDRDAYPSVVDGRIVWIVDGYTTASTYPYSATKSLSETLSDSADTTTEYPTDSINYIRNSVKATVDAYSGKVTLYTWDAKDPVLKAWQKVFPNTLKPMADMSAQLISHVRYPEDLFRVQRDVLGRYHVTNATSWFNGDDTWKTPPEPRGSNANLSQPPYYLTLKAPQQTSPTFSLYSTYIPNRSDAGATGNLTGYLAVDADAGATKGAKAADYGTLRLLVLPKNSVTVNGPGQEQSAFNTDTNVAAEIALLKRGDTTVPKGNLLTLPVGGGLLYVQPVYVKSSSETSYPLLRKVLVGFGTKVEFEDTLSAALDKLFGGDSGATTGDSGVSSSASATPSPSGSSSTGTGTSGTQSAALKKALTDANTALQAREADYAKNDLVGAAQEDQKLQTAIAAAIAAGG